MKLLKRDDVKKYLTNYDRPKRVFYKASEYQDTVSSEYICRDGGGQQYKPARLLGTVRQIRPRQSRQGVEAIQILLDRPKEWSAQALSELKAKLASSPERFTFEQLEKAHAAHYHKALIDIISMVKHAAKDGEPLLTALERVERAFKTLTAGRSIYGGRNSNGWAASVNIW